MTKAAMTWATETLVGSRSCRCASRFTLPNGHSNSGLEEGTNQFIRLGTPSCGGHERDIIWEVCAALFFWKAAGNCKILFDRWCGKGGYTECKGTCPETPRRNGRQTMLVLFILHGVVGLGPNISLACASSARCGWIQSTYTTFAPPCTRQHVHKTSSQCIHWLKHHTVWLQQVCFSVL